MTINTCVFILCLGIVVVLGGLAMLCCMNKEEAGAKTMLAGFCYRVLGRYAYCSGQSALHRPSLSG